MIFHRLLLNVFLSVFCIAAKADPKSDVILGYDLGTETIDSFIQKSRTEGSGPITLVHPGSAHPQAEFGDLVKVYEPQVYAEFPDGMKINPRVRSVYAHFTNSGHLYVLNVTVEGGNELAGILLTILAKYPEQKNQNSWQKEARDAPYEPVNDKIGANDCNYFMETNDIRVCATNENTIEKADRNKAECVGEVGYCRKRMFIQYIFKGLIDKGAEEWKNKYEELTKIKEQEDLKNSAGL